MTLSISKGRYPNSYSFLLSKEIRSYFLQNQIVVIETEDHIMIREAMLSDTKTHSLSKSNGAFTYTPKYHENIIGTWAMEKQGDLFILTEKI